MVTLSIILFVFLAWLLIIAVADNKFKDPKYKEVGFVGYGMASLIGMLLIMMFFLVLGGFVTIGAGKGVGAVYTFVGVTPWFYLADTILGWLLLTTWMDYNTPELRFSDAKSVTLCIYAVLGLLLMFFVIFPLTAAMPGLLA